MNPVSMLRVCCFVGLGTLSLGSEPALADHVSIDPSVTSVVFDPGTQTRAIAGDRHGAYLVIERLNQRQSEPMLIAELPLEGANVPISEFKNLSLRALKGPSLTFDVAPRRGGARADIQCSASLAFGKGRVKLERISCSRGGQPYDPAPAPAPAPAADTSMEDIKAASEACNKLSYAANDRKRCLDSTLVLMKTRFRKSAIATVAACGELSYAMSTRQWCLDAVSRTKREPVELIRYCKEQSYSENDRKECITKFSSL